MVHSTKAIALPAGAWQMLPPLCFASLSGGRDHMAVDASLAPLLDFAVLARWLDEQGLPRGELENVSSIAGGTQNIMLRFTRGGREYVLRRPPKHLRPKSNDALRREARV